MSWLLLNSDKACCIWPLVVESQTFGITWIAAVLTPLTFLLSSFYFTHQKNLPSRGNKLYRCCNSNECISRKRNSCEVRVLKYLTAAFFVSKDYWTWKVGCGIKTFLVLNIKRIPVTVFWQPFKKDNIYEGFKYFLDEKICIYNE